MFKIFCITNRKLCKDDFVQTIERVVSEYKSLQVIEKALEKEISLGKNELLVSSNMKLTDEDGLKESTFENIGEGMTNSNLPKPDMLILREKDLSEDEYYELAKKIKPMCDKAGVELVIHTYVNVAKKLGVKSIHLPLDKYIMLTEEDKQLFDNIGTSVHSLDDLEKAISLGANYVLAGHIYDTDCKKGLPGRGLEFLQEICSNVRVPVIAIGGINMDRLKEVKDVGASGAAIMSGYMN
ncbi:Thiamine monophosphate synthase/TENI [Eubacterium uniforme]|uniref:Thiamine monophosphate synthase/TENI n=1 Tax=Eubacterium uniforme TaxID=39495 RepID=A0A1T4VKW1_9FIRM|nr:thiamine phosphate synthase [Eubacterium uniforme]SKA65508.1 Thiamine monophosphate synthase/TENI [Eubacterium uniforme]